MDPSGRCWSGAPSGYEVGPQRVVVGIAEPALGSDALDAASGGAAMTPRVLIGNLALSAILLCSYQLGATHSWEWGVGMIASSAVIGAALGYAREVPR